MPVTYEWYDDKKSIVKFAITAPWTVPEFSQSESVVRAEFSQFNHVVDAILDFSDGTILPKNALSYFASSLRKGENIKNEGVAVVYGANMLVHMIGRSLKQIIRNADIHFASSLEEAETILADVKSKRTQ